MYAYLRRRRFSASMLLCRCRRRKKMSTAVSASAPARPSDRPSASATRFGPLGAWSVSVTSWPGRLLLGAVVVPLGLLLSLPVLVPLPVPVPVPVLPAWSAMWKKDDRARTGTLSMLASSTDRFQTAGLISSS